MKRFHVHVSVNDLEQSIQFYTTFFNSQPSVKKDDYAKWMLDDPRINFAISKRGATQPGLDHLGIQVEDEQSLHEISARLKEAKQAVLEQEKTTCCYAESDKAWVMDPQGIAWESFYTIGSATTYGEDVLLVREGATAACCAPNEVPTKIAVSFEKSSLDKPVVKKNDCCK